MLGRCGPQGGSYSKEWWLANFMIAHVCLSVSNGQTDLESFTSLPGKCLLPPLRPRPVLTFYSLFTRLPFPQQGCWFVEGKAGLGLSLLSSTFACLTLSKNALPHHSLASWGLCQVDSMKLYWQLRILHCCLCLVLYLLYLGVQTEGANYPCRWGCGHWNYSQTASHSNNAEQRDLQSVLLLFINYLQTIHI